MAQLVYAPFTEEQVESIGSYQNAGWTHPFTCTCSKEQILVVTADGLVCQKCQKVQKWAHSFMSDGSWKNAAPPTPF